MSNKVEKLEFYDNPTIETEAIAVLQSSLGKDEARQMVDRAVCEMADRMWLIKDSIQRDDLGSARRFATGLSAVSSQLGLVDFSQTASDLRECIEREDIFSLHAVMHRMLRIGEKSLFYAAEFQNSEPEFSS